MGMFSDLMGKIFRNSAEAEHPYDAAPARTTPAPGAPGPISSSPAAGTATATNVDVEAILEKLAKASTEKLDWRHSIVDMMKLLGMDSSLSARKELAADLHYSGDTSDSATMNMWLHKEVMKKLAENGGRVPASMLSH